MISNSTNDLAAILASFLRPRRSLRKDFANWSAWSSDKPFFLSSTLFSTAFLSFLCFFFPLPPPGPKPRDWRLSPLDGLSRRSHAPTHSSQDHRRTGGNQTQPPLPLTSWRFRSSTGNQEILQTPAPEFSRGNAECAPLNLGTQLPKPM